MPIKNKLSTVFLFLILSSCSADNDSEYEQYQNSEDRANVEKMIYSSYDNFEVEGVTVIFKDPGAVSSMRSSGAGLSLVVARCETYSQLVMYLGSRVSSEVIELKDAVEKTFNQDAKNHFPGVYFVTKSTTKELVKRTKENLDAVSKTEIIVSMKSDFGDLTLNCDIENEVNNGLKSYKESGSYSQPDKYVDIFFEKMRSLGFKEDVFRSGNAVGVSLRYKIKI